MKQKVEKLEQKLEGKNGARVEAAQPSPPRIEIFAPLEQLFNRNEGIVLKKGDDIVIRLYGLDFVERASIEMRNVYLLDRVKQAIDMYPGQQITVEGHAYIYGTDQENLKVSRERADAVKRYLQENWGIDRPAMVAIGYGNTNAISNQELANGHIGNDRVDIVIARRKENMFSYQNKPN